MERAVKISGTFESTVDEFVSADDGVATTVEPGNEDYIADIVPSTNESRHIEESNYGPLPTSSEVIGALALVRCFCANAEGCGLSCSDSLDNVGKCVRRRQRNCPSRRKCRTNLCETKLVSSIK